MKRIAPLLLLSLLLLLCGLSPARAQTLLYTSAGNWTGGPTTAGAAGTSTAVPGLVDKLGTTWTLNSQNQVVGNSTSYTANQLYYPVAKLAERAQAVLGVSSGDNALWVRLQASGTGYFAWMPNPSIYEVDYVTGGVKTPIVTGSFTQSAVAGDTLQFDAVPNAGTANTTDLVLRHIPLTGTGTTISGGAMTANASAGAQGAGYAALGGYQNVTYSSFQAFDLSVAVATAFTLAAPASVMVGQPGTFTATPNGALTAAETVTPSDGGAGGAFSPASLSFASGATAAQSFTYTPALAGTGTVTVTASPSPSLGTAPAASCAVFSVLPVVNLLGIGDSITAGYNLASASLAPVARTAAYLPKLGKLRTVNVLNRGAGGQTTTNWQPGGTLLNAAVDAAIAQFGTPSASNPIYAYIRLGANDARPGSQVSLATVRTNLANICAYCISRGLVPVLAYPTYLNTSSGSWDATSAPYLQSLLPQIDSVVDGRTVLAGDKLCNDYTHRHPEEQQDGAHPNQAGADNLGLLDAGALYSNVLAPAPAPSSASRGQIRRGR